MRRPIHSADFAAFRAFGRRAQLLRDRASGAKFAVPRHCVVFFVASCTLAARAGVCLSPSGRVTREPSRIGRVRRAEKPAAAAAALRRAPRVHRIDATFAMYMLQPQKRATVHASFPACCFHRLRRLLHNSPFGLRQDARLRCENIARRKPCEAHCPLPFRGAASSHILQQIVRPADVRVAAIR